MAAVQGSAPGAGSPAFARRAGRRPPTPPVQHIPFDKMSSQTLNDRLTGDGAWHTDSGTSAPRAASALFRALLFVVGISLVIHLVGVLSTVCTTGVSIVDAVVSAGCANIAEHFYATEAERMRGELNTADDAASESSAAPYQPFADRKPVCADCSDEWGGEDKTCIGAQNLISEIESAQRKVASTLRVATNLIRLIDLAKCEVSATVNARASVCSSISICSSSSFCAPYNREGR